MYPLDDQVQSSALDAILVVLKYHNQKVDLILMLLDCLRFLSPTSKPLVIGNQLFQIVIAESLHGSEMFISVFPLFLFGSYIMLKIAQNLFYVYSNLSQSPELQKTPRQRGAHSSSKTSQAGRAFTSVKSSQFFFIYNIIVILSWCRISLSIL